MSWIKAAPLLLLALTACEQTVATRINEQPMQTKFVAKEVILAGDGDMHVAADAWKRGGQSPIHIVSTYSPGNKEIAEHNATTAAARLRALGVSDVTTETMPAHSTEVIAHMTNLEAGAAHSCGQIPGLGHATLGNAYDYGSYRMGCTVDDMMGKQVASTPDLEGRVPGQNFGRTTDAQRAGNVVDVYRTGKPNEPLKGLVSSDIAESD